MNKINKKTIAIFITFILTLCVICLALNIRQSKAESNITDKITIVNGASIRFDKAYDKENVQTGIRFFADVDKELAEKLLENNSFKQNCEIGMFVLPYSYICEFESQSETKDYFEYFATNKNLSKEQVGVSFSSEQLSVNKNSRVWCSIDSLLDANFNEKYSAVAYYTEDGEKYFYSETGACFTVAEIVNMALLDTEYGYTNEQRVALSNIMKKSILLQNGKSDYSLTLVKNGNGTNLKTRYANNTNVENLSMTIVSGNENVVLDENFQLKGILKGKAVVNVKSYNGLIDIDLDVTVREELEKQNVSYNVIDSNKQINVKDLGLNIVKNISLDNVTFNVISASFNGEDVTFEGETFTASDSGVYKLKVLATDTYGNELAIQSANVNVKYFDDIEEYNKELLLFDSQNSLEIVSSKSNVMLIEDSEAQGGYALEATFDNYNWRSNILEIDLGGNYKLSEILAIKISYKIVYAGGNRWSTVAVNSKEKVISWHYAMRSSTNDEYTGQAKVMDDYVDVVITQERLKGSDANNPILNDEYIQSLLFYDSSNTPTQTVYTTVRIASIEVVTKPTVQEMNNLLKFNSEDSLDLITNVKGRSIVADEKAEGGYALEASFDNINWSGNRLTINLGGDHKLSEISSIKISYKVVYGNEKIWTDVGVNGRDTLIDWWKIMKESTGDKYTNQNVVMDDYVDVVITPERLKGRYEDSQISNDTLISSLVFFDSSNRTDETYRTTVRIASIEIKVKPTKENISELLKFNDYRSLSLITSSRETKIVADETAKGGYAVETGYDSINNVIKPLTIDLGGNYKLSEILAIKISYKIIYAGGNRWATVAVNSKEKVLGWHAIMRCSTKEQYNGQAQVMDDYVDVVITQERLKGSDADNPILNDEYIQSLLFFDGSYGATETVYTTVRIASIEVVTKPTVQEMNNLLKFNSEDSLDLITNVKGRSLVKDETAEGGYALEASFDNINWSGNWLTINLGSNYKLSEISSIKVSYKVVYGSGVWYGAGVNGKTTAIDWWKIMKESTNNKYTNQSVAMDDYVDVVITQEYLKGGYNNTPELADDTLISSLVLFDSNRTQDSQYTTVRIASIEIETIS